MVVISINHLLVINSNLGLSVEIKTTEKLRYVVNPKECYATGCILSHKVPLGHMHRCQPIKTGKWDKIQGFQWDILKIWCGLTKNQSNLEVPKVGHGHQKVRKYSFGHQKVRLSLLMWDGWRVWIIMCCTYWSVTRKCSCSISWVSEVLASFCSSFSFARGFSSQPQLSLFSFHHQQIISLPLEIVEHIYRESRLKLIIRLASLAIIFLIRRTLAMNYTSWGIIIDHSYVLICRHPDSSFRPSFDGLLHELIELEKKLLLPQETTGEQEDRFTDLGRSLEHGKDLYTELQRIYLTENQQIA